MHTAYFVFFMLSSSDFQSHKTEYCMELVNLELQ